MARIKSFVLRSGRISRAQERSYREGGSFLVPFTGTAADPAGYFGNDRPVTVEIGFGMGWATAEIAAAHPENNYLGIEVFRAGIGKLVWEAERRGLSNIRIIEHDAAEALETMVPPGSVAAFHLFFPDPWPKKRHHKRRLVQRPFAELLVSRLAEGGFLYMVTDWEDYARQALDVFSALPELDNPYRMREGGFAPRQDWRPRTKFETRGLDKNHTIREIYFVKRRIEQVERIGH